MKITDLYIDRDVLNLEVTRVICDRLKMSGQVVESAEPVYEKLSRAAAPVDQGKKTLFLTRNKGAFLRPCPGTDYYTCCNYMILHFGTFCTMDCSYCILQSYFHPPVLQFFVNHDELDAALDDFFQGKKRGRIGTGEFTDSLIWEDIYPFTSRLIEKFATQNHAVLEVKSKTIHIDHLLTLPHNQKTIMAWSLNSFDIVRTEERRTASLDERLAAAVKCQDHGYPLAFHFDPLIIYPGAEAAYRLIIEKLFAAIRPEAIVWISLGTFRFMPDLKAIIEQRFDRSKIIYGEFIRGLDGKMRYFKPLRIRFYQYIISVIREFAPHVTFYFCMEDDEVWEKSLGFLPDHYGGLPAILDQSASRHCGVF